MHDGIYGREDDLNALYYRAVRPREGYEQAKAWLLDCDWAEGGEAQEYIRCLNHVGVVAAVERHYEGGYEQFLADDHNLKTPA